MSLANKYSEEGILDNNKTIKFPMPMRKLVLINDSSTTDIRFKFNESENWSTLKGNETLQVEDMRMPELYLQCSGAKYRLWALG